MLRGISSLRLWLLARMHLFPGGFSIASMRSLMQVGRVQVVFVLVAQRSPHCRQGNVQQSSPFSAGRFCRILLLPSRRLHTALQLSAQASPTNLWPTAGVCSHAKLSTQARAPRFVGSHSRRGTSGIQVRAKRYWGERIQDTANRQRSYICICATGGSHSGGSDIRRRSHFLLLLRLHILVTSSQSAHPDVTLDPCAQR